MKKELTKQFFVEEFSWIDDILLDEEGKEQTKDNPTDRVSTDNVINIENTKGYRPTARQLPHLLRVFLDLRSTP